MGVPTRSAPHAPQQVGEGYERSDLIPSGVVNREVFIGCDRALIIDLTQLKE